MRTICVTGARGSSPSAARHRAEGDRPRQRIGEGAAQGDQRRVRGPALGVAAAAGLLGLGEREAERARDHEVDDDRADHRPRGGIAEHRDEQRHAHEAGVRERRDEGAERGVAQVDAGRAAARAQRRADRQRHHQQGRDQVDAEQRRIGEPRQRQARAEAEQHARQAKNST
jgi:hypothetical protein